MWSLAGAILYAVYIVMIKRRVDREDKLDIPMFFGNEMLVALSFKSVVVFSFSFLAMFAPCFRTNALPNLYSVSFFTP